MLGSTNKIYYKYSMQIYAKIDIQFPSTVQTDLLYKLFLQLVLRLVLKRQNKEMEKLLKNDVTCH